MIDYQNYLRRFLEYCHVHDTQTEIYLLCVIPLITFYQFVGLQLLPGIVVNKFFGGHDESFWYEDRGFMGRDLTTQYIICTYRAVSALFGTGYEGFKSKNVYDKVFLSFMCIFGSIARCVIFVKILEKLKCLQYHRYKYEEIMNQIQRYVRHKKLPARIHEKFGKFYDFHYRGSYFPEEKIEECVSGQLKQDILVHNMRVLVEKISVLSKLPSSVFQSIVSKLHREVVLEGETIVSCGEIETAMYFIASGSVAILSPSGIELDHIFDGDFFGGATLVLDYDRRVLTCVALETCELYRYVIKL